MDLLLWAIVVVLLIILVLQGLLAVAQLRLIASLTLNLEEKVTTMADTQADTTAQIQTKISELMAKATINTDRLASIRDLLHGYRAEVQKFVARAVAAANPNNPDPAALNAALDNLNTLNAELDTQAAAEAVIMNTEAPDSSTLDPLSTSPDGQKLPPSNQPTPPVVKPFISGITPSAGLNAGGDSVVISGSGFQAASPDGSFGVLGITFDGNEVPSFTVNSDTSISTTTPASAFPDAHDANVVVTGANGAAAGTFTYEAAIDPNAVAPIPAATQAEMDAGSNALAGTPVETTPVDAGPAAEPSPSPETVPSEVPADQTPA